MCTNKKPAAKPPKKARKLPWSAGGFCINAPGNKLYNSRPFRDMKNERHHHILESFSRLPCHRFYAAKFWGWINKKSINLMNGKMDGVRRGRHDKMGVKHKYLWIMGSIRSFFWKAGETNRQTHRITLVFTRFVRWRKFLMNLCIRKIQIFLE